MVRKLLKNIKIYLILSFGFLLLSNVNSQISVSGKVISASDNAPLPGATVVIAGKAKGTITNLDGEFKLTVADSSEKIQISFVGYLTETVKVGNQSVINVSLVQDLMNLDEVIVTAYSERSKTEISSAVVSLKASDINQVTVNSVADMLTGKVAGVQVQNASGQPGEGGDIRIRGVGSVFSPQKPLIVVDGVIGGSYNPNDVESISVLKDAGATGLYGSQAASGVLIITTKSGKAGKSLITAKVSHGIKKPEFGNFEVMNSEELYNYQKQLYTPAAFSTLRPRSLLKKDYDWINNSYKKCEITTANLSAQGGNEKTNYYLGLDYMDDEGTLISTNYKRMSIHSKVKYALNDRLSITSNIAGNMSTQQIPHWSLAEGTFRLMPWDNPYDANGDLVYDVKDNDAKWYSNVTNNPYHSIKYNKYDNNSIGASGSFTVDLKLIDELSVESRTSIAAGYGKYEEIQSPLSFEGASTGGRLFNSINFDRSYGNTTLIKFKKTFGVHSISGLAGVEGGKWVIDYNYGGTGFGFLPGKEVLSAAGSGGAPTGTRGEVSKFSVLSQINYDLSKKYFATASMRRDGSSKFSPNHKYATFFTYSLSWLISSEDFMKSISAINMMKLRASYGAVGNETFPGDSYYPYFASFTPGNTYNKQTAYYPDNAGNYDLTWETSYPLNIGFELTILKKLEFNIDYYNSKTIDLLFMDPSPASKGFEYQWKNVGEIKNKGVEFAVNGSLITTKDFTWDLNFNISANSNELTKLSDKQGVDNIIIPGTTANQILVPGESAFDWYMPKWEGVNPENGDPQWEKINYDANGKVTGSELTSIYTEATLQSVGSPFPKFQGGFGTGLTYKGLSLTAAFAYVYGNKVYNYTRQELDNDGANPNINAFKLQDGMSRWEKPGDNATHPKPILGGNNNAHEYSSRYLEDGSYLRLRNVTLSYSLPANIVKRARLASCKVNLSVDNAKTWTKFTGMDPDVPLYMSAYQLPGLSMFKYPISKQYLLGLEISF